MKKLTSCLLHVSFVRFGQYCLLERFAHLLVTSILLTAPLAGIYVLFTSILARIDFITPNSNDEFTTIPNVEQSFDFNEVI
jgi:hypothetical protein